MNILGELEGVKLSGEVLPWWAILIIVLLAFLIILFGLTFLFLKNYVKKINDIHNKTSIKKTNPPAFFKAILISLFIRNFNQKKIEKSL